MIYVVEYEEEQDYWVECGWFRRGERRAARRMQQRLEYHAGIVARIRRVRIDES